MYSCQKPNPSSLAADPSVWRTIWTRYNRLRGSPESGHQFVLTMMCAATRYPEAIPLHTIKAKPIVKALTKFFSTFGLAKIIQSDQGTNFTSKLFKQVVSELNIKRVKSSPYHPESQGALERFHLTALRVIENGMKVYPFFCLLQEKLGKSL